MSAKRYTLKEAEEVLAVKKQLTCPHYSWEMEQTVDFPRRPVTIRCTACKVEHTVDPVPLATRTQR